MPATAPPKQHGQPSAVGGTRSLAGSDRHSRSRSRRIALALTVTAAFLTINAVTVFNGWSPFQIPGDGALPRLHHYAAEASPPTAPGLRRGASSGS